MSPKMREYLTLGPTIRCAPSKPKRYELTRPAHLPKSRPAAARARDLPSGAVGLEAASVRPPPAAAPEPVASVGALCEAAAARGGARRIKELPAQAPADPHRPSVWERALGWVRGFRPRGKPRQAVQSELALTGVRVVRNDLTTFEDLDFREGHGASQVDWRLLAAASREGRAAQSTRGPESKNPGSTLRQGELL